jgi:hypothetical protein
LSNTNPFAQQTLAYAVAGKIISHNRKKYMKKKSDRPINQSARKEICGKKVKLVFIQKKNCKGKKHEEK